MFLMAITPGKGFEADAWSRVLTSGIDALMIREKDMDALPLLEAARFCRTRFPEVEIWINGREDVAVLADCGFHAPERHPVIGLTSRCSRPLHDVKSFQDKTSAHQLILSPVFEVPGKNAPLGVEGLHSMLDDLSPFTGRILALGGLGPGRIQGLRHPRLDGLAVIRALWETPQPQGVVEHLRAEWEA